MALDPYALFVGISLVLFLPISFYVVCAPFIPTKYRSIPTRATKRNNDCALSKGWPLISVRFMQTYQHLTVCTMQLTTVYLLLSSLQLALQPPEESWLPLVRCGVRLILPGAGSVVAHFWTFICCFGPWSLVDREDFPSDEKKAADLVQRCFFRLSWTPACFFLMIMHLQHTWLPLLPWVEAAFFDTGCQPESIMKQLLLTIGYMLSWLCFGLIVWVARENPPYPIMRDVWRNGWWPVMYGLMILQTLVALMLSKVWLAF